MLKKIIASKNTFIFDMDGTLVNLERLNYNSYNETLSELLNLRISNEDYQKFFSGTKTADGFSKYLESNGIGSSKETIEKLVKVFREKKAYIIESSFDDNVLLVGGAKEFLIYLSSNNKKVILATSTIKKFTLEILRKLSIDKYFDYIITAEDITHGKPNPEIFLKALQVSEAQRDESVIFEDSLNGIQAAKASGVLCIGIHTKGLNDIPVKQADIIINDYTL